MTRGIGARLCALVFIAIMASETLVASAQTLIVPLTGKRVRYIQAEWLFRTLFHDFFPEDDDTTYVQTGDIPAMWLRDSSAQAIPYVRFQQAFPILRGRIRGVIERDARNIEKDPYANAFQASYHVWERKWEIDSLAWPVLLAHLYWNESHDRSLFSYDLHRALRKIVDTYACEQHHDRCKHYLYPYHVPTENRYNDDTGMLWSAFRPSDDPVRYRFNIPQNIIAAIALHELSTLALDGYADKALAQRAKAIEAAVTVGVIRYGRFYNTARGAWMYAYETDGFGANNLMDDANVPNLTTLPYLGWCSANDPTYLATRAFTLSKDNPWYFSARYAQGLGSPHTPFGYVWPLGIIGRALTSTSSREVAEAVTTLAETDSESGMIHESFYADGYWRFTRAEFGWANALYAELLFRSVAGLAPLPFVDEGTMMPPEPLRETPALLPSITQLFNAATVDTTLDRLLNEGRAAAIGDP